jgi:hypothetical protein
MSTRLPSGLTQRFSSGREGRVNIPADPGSEILVRAFSPAIMQGLQAQVTVRSPGVGTKLSIPLAPFDTSGTDADGDGLADNVEDVIGSDPTDVDTDNDGVSDFREIREGTDPLGGVPAASGVISTADTPGTALDVCTIDNLAAIADAQSGVSIFNIFGGLTPTLIARVDTPGTAQAVACASGTIAVADGASGLALIDSADPAGSSGSTRRPGRSPAGWRSAARAVSRTSPSAGRCSTR